MQEQWLPLFPLSAVLFPRTPLPLHIFEDRYKEMMADVMGPHAEFGIVLAQEKGILNIGCTATVEKVLKTYPGGEMDIFTVGRRRFEIVLLNEDKSYLRGSAQFFDDDDFDAVGDDIRAQALEGYRALKDVRPPESYQEPELSDPQLSFQLAQLVPDIDFRQILLRTRSEAQRMKQLAEYLPVCIAKLRYSNHVKQVAPTNGRGQRT